MSEEVWEWLIYVEGCVQGVGFRSAVFKQAMLHHIFGYVRNRCDGGVEICAQGSVMNLDAFAESVRLRLGVGSIDQFKIERRRPETLFSSFEIR